MSQRSNSRHKAFLRQGGRCCYCGLPMCQPDQVTAFAARQRITVKLAKQLECTAEHIDAAQDGGGNGCSNIAAACRFCNKHRHSRSGNFGPAPDVYFERVVTRMAAGRWHPANGLLRVP